MISIVKLMLVMATVLGVVTTINLTPPKGQSSVESQLKNDAQEALNAIGSTHKLTASHSLANRGQHVFNNGLLKFHRSVLEKLLEAVGVYDQLDNLEQYLEIPLKQDQQTISETMVVRFSPEDNYVDYNAAVFGEYVRELREALVDYLKAETSVYKDDRYRIQEKRKRVELIVTQMVNREVYVDPMARDRWLQEEKKQKQAREKLYNQVRDALKKFKNILKNFKNVSDKIRVFLRTNKWDR